MYSAQQIDALLCITIGWPMNLLLIWLILKKTKKYMRIWSWLLLQTALIDLANLLVFFIVQPSLLFNANVAGFYSEGPFGQCSMEIISFFNAFFLYFFELSKYAIAGQFFYRWTIICRDRKPSFLTYGSAICIPIIVAFLPPFSTFLAKDFNAPQQTAATCPKCPQDRIIIFNKSNLSMIHSIIFMVTNLTTYSIILATSISIWRKTRQSMLPEHQHSREFSRQIGWVLFIQALVPFFLSLLPTLLISIFVAAGLNITETITVISLQPWPSVLSPLTTIFIIGQYRRCLSKFLCKKKVLTTSTNAIQRILPINATN